MKRTKNAALGLALLALAAAHAHAAVEPIDVRERTAIHDVLRNLACWSTSRGVALRIDNDLFAGGKHDSDYTGGLALDWTPERQDPGAGPHRLHVALDRLLGLDALACRRHVWRLGLIAMTPGTLRSRAPVLDDRPFASALIFGTSAVWNGAVDNVSWQSSLTVGVLGLDIAESLQRAAHRLVDDEEPHGYEHQVSAGGELTARYMLARHALLSDGFRRGHVLQIKNTAALSVGFLTEASVALSARWGRISSPWQSFTPETADYLPAAIPLAESDGGKEWYAFAGTRVKLRAYSAFAQGQFRESVHVLHASQLERALAEAWLGVHWRPSPSWALTYTVRVQTPELREDPGRRTLIWASLGVSRHFQ